MEEEIKVKSLPVDVQGHHLGIRAAFQHLNQGATVCPRIRRSLRRLQVLSVHRTTAL
jgi:hypothetical protein